MNLYRVPPTANFQIPNCALITPDGTFVYISFSHIVCLKTSENGDINTFVMEIGPRVQAIDCDLDFSRTKYLACSLEDKHIYIFDLDKKIPVYGHSAHVEKSKQSKDRDRDYLDPLPICFTLNKKVVSASRNRFVIYCVASNTYKVNTEIGKKHIFTVLKVSPYDANIIGAGTKDGLIIVMSIKNMTVIHTMRGHDSEIRSLDWMKTSQVPAEEEDLFDMYTSNDPETEFGVITEKRNDANFESEVPTCTNTIHEVIENMNEEGFDFAEACQALKQDMLVTKECVTETNFDFKEVETGKKAHTDSFSDTSEAPSREDDFKSVENGVTNEVPDNLVENDDLILLLSSASEPKFWVWDAQKGCALDKIQFASGNYHKQNSKNFYFSAKWLNPFTIITNDHQGAILLWDIEYRGEGKLSIHKSKSEYSLKLIMHLTVDLNTEHVWAISLHSTIINLDLQSEKNPIKEYSTLNSRINQFSINPIDPNVIAIACNKRISLLNVSKLNENYVFMDGMANQVHSQVLTVAWHPEKENLLAFSTREGRIGIFDTTKLQNCPTIMKPFFSKDVYSVTWAKFTTKVSEEPTWHLFCCGFAGKASHLVYYPQNGNGKFVPTQVKHFQNVTSTLASQEYLAIGCFDGTVHLADLSDATLTPFYSQKVGSKLISGFCFSTNKLAVASFDHEITILHIESKEKITFQKIKGHRSGVTSVSWSLKNPELLVSTSSDCTVRIWNTNDTNSSAEENVATFERDTFAAIFYPTNDDLIIVGGANFMMTIYNYKETSIDFSRRSNKNAAKPLMASIDEANVVKKAKKEKKKNLLVQKRLERSLKDQENSINRTEEEVINGINEIHLDETSKSDQNDLREQSAVCLTVEGNTKDLSIAKSDKNKKDSSIQFNYSSIFFLTPRELNRDPIGMLKNLIESKEDDDKKWQLRHEKLFSSEQNVVKSLLNEEYSHQIASNAQSVGLLTLPMLTMDIKSVILEKISQKTLTEEYIAVAPFISHTFWRNTCLAFAHQCVEQGLVLKAISYFLCCYDVNDAISVLCRSNNYTEAMAIAKMRKSENDPIFKDIVQKWTKYLDYCGNFEGAAIVWMAFGDNKSALEVLKKRSNPDEDLMKIIDKLKDLNGEAST